MPAPAVSVVIPTYNHAHFLGLALQSLREQTFGNWEAIVVNNFSEDNTAEVVASFNDPRIRLENFRNHGIIAASRNHGWRLARGRLIAFLDSDDCWYPRKLEQCVARLGADCDLVCHGERWIGNGQDRAVRYGPAPRATYDALLFKGNCISTSAVVVKREHLEKVGGFCEDAAIVTAEDYELWLRLAQAGARIGFVDEILGEYRLHAGNQSGAVLRNMEAVDEVVRRHLTVSPPQTLRGRLRARRRQAIVYYSGARGLQAAGQHANAARLFRKALRHWPVSAKFYAAMLINAVGYRVP
jgi:glycosyltransferase involved in cell wall biosynthesis